MVSFIPKSQDLAMFLRAGMQIYTILSSILRMGGLTDVLAQQCNTLGGGGGGLHSPDITEFLVSGTEEHMYILTTRFLLSHQYLDMRKIPDFYRLFYSCDMEVGCRQWDAI